MPYKHRPLSSILAPTPDPAAEGSKTDQPRNEKGQFVSPDTQEPSTLPEKYQGKTVEEVAKMHMNAEQELGRVRNEVGNYRGLVADLTSLHRTAPEPQKVEQEKIDVSGDELLTDPAGAIDRVVNARLNERDKADQITRDEDVLRAEGAALMAAFPNIDEIVASQEFSEFASRTPTRQQDFVTAAQGSGLDQVRAARRLLEDFADFKAATTPANEGTVNKGPEGDPNPGVQAAAQVSTEGAGPSGAVSTKPQIFEADVIKMIHNEPDKYRSPSFQAELMEAMREGRYVKSG